MIWPQRMFLVSMKVAISIWWVFMVFVAGAAVRAQTDTTIYLFCGSVGGSCTYTVTETDLSTGKTVTSWSVEGSGSIAINDTLHSTNGWFYVDTSSKTIRMLQYGSRTLHYPNNGGFYPDGEEGVQVTFDALPYTPIGNGYLNVKGMYLARVDFHSLRWSDEHNYQYSGGCEHIDTLLDSVSLIIRSGLSTVDVFPVTTNSLQVVSDGSSNVFTFQVAKWDRKLEIINLLGSIDYSTTVPGNASFVQISVAVLPPGCYFARLGNAVAKFIVPPR